MERKFKKGGIAMHKKYPLVASLAGIYLTLFGAASAAAEEAAPPAYINSTPEAYAQMQGLPMDEPLQMLNMIRFKEKAEYAEGSEFATKDWTGEQAYAEYSRRSSPIANRVGGKPIYIGVPQLTLIGPQHEKWDAAFIIEYPDLATFLALVNDPEYKKHAFHRSAAVADSRLIRMTPPAQ